MLTVIVPQRAGQADVAWEAERLESETAVGVRVLLNGKTTLTAFRKADQGKASLGKDSFDAALHIVSE